MHFFFMPILFDVRAIEPGKDIPVDVPHIIASRVIPVVVEFSAGSPFAGEMFTTAAVRHPPHRQQPHPLDPCQGRVFQKR